MSIEVLAMARSRSGLCCDTSEPTRRPLAQKLDVSAEPGARSRGKNLLLAHSVDDMQTRLVERDTQLLLDVEAEHTGERWLIRAGYVVLAGSQLGSSLGSYRYSHKRSWHRSHR